MKCIGDYVAYTERTLRTGGRTSEIYEMARYGRSDKDFARSAALCAKMTALLCATLAVAIAAAL